MLACWLDLPQKGFSGDENQMICIYKRHFMVCLYFTSGYVWQELAVANLPLAFGAVRASLHPILTATDHLFNQEMSRKWPSKAKIQKAHERFLHYRLCNSHNWPFYFSVHKHVNCLAPKIYVKFICSCHKSVNVNLINMSLIND